ncbi:MAG: palindromic element RPE4 domain-containing protein [Rickettsia endosymbiont of Pentastiridius leporinus]
MKYFFLDPVVKPRYDKFGIFWIAALPMVARNDDSVST